MPSYKVLINDNAHYMDESERADKLLEMRVLIRRHQLFEFLPLPVQQPAELRGTLRDGDRERLEGRVGEQHDHLGPDVERRIVVGRVENAQRDTW